MSKRKIHKVAMDRHLGIEDSAARPSKRKTLQSPVEGLTREEVTAERLNQFTKRELAMYIVDILGGSWAAVLSNSKDALVARIIDNKGDFAED